MMQVIDTTKDFELFEGFSPHKPGLTLTSTRSFGNNNQALPVGWSVSRVRHTQDRIGSVALSRKRLLLVFY